MMPQGLGQAMTIMTYVFTLYFLLEMIVSSTTTSHSASLLV